MGYSFRTYSKPGLRNAARHQSYANLSFSSLGQLCTQNTTTTQLQRKVELHYCPSPLFASIARFCTKNILKPKGQVALYALLLPSLLETFFLEGGEWEPGLDRYLLPFLVGWSDCIGSSPSFLPARNVLGHIISPRRPRNHSQSTVRLQHAQCEMGCEP